MSFRSSHLCSAWCSSHWRKVSLRDSVEERSEFSCTAAGLKDKYSSLEVLCLLESLERLRTEVRWVHSHAQLAGALTKPPPPGILHKVMSEVIGPSILIPRLQARRNFVRVNVLISLTILGVCQFSLWIMLRCLIAQFRLTRGPIPLEGSLLPWTFAMDLASLATWWNVRRYVRCRLCGTCGSIGNYNWLCAILRWARDSALQTLELRIHLSSHWQLPTGYRLYAAS